VAILRMWWWTTPLQSKAATPGRVPAGCVWPSRAPSMPASMRAGHISGAAEDYAALFPQRPQPEAAWIEMALFGPRPRSQHCSTPDKSPSASAKTPGGAPLLSLSSVPMARLTARRGMAAPTLTRCAGAAAALRRKVFSGACSERAPRCAGTAPPLNTRT
jgi:hypothetical protein